MSGFDLRLELTLSPVHVSWSLWEGASDRRDVQVYRGKADVSRLMKRLRYQEPIQIYFVIFLRSGRISPCAFPSKWVWLISAVLSVVH